MKAQLSADRLAKLAVMGISGSQLSICAYQYADHQRLLDALAPHLRGGAQSLDWLSQVLEQVEDERHWTMGHLLVDSEQNIRGVALEQRKGMRGVELVYFWIDPNYRWQGWGEILLEHCLQQWQLRSVSRASVAVPLRLISQLRTLLVRYDFAYDMFDQRITYEPVCIFWLRRILCSS